MREAQECAHEYEEHKKEIDEALAIYTKLADEIITKYGPQVGQVLGKLIATYTSTFVEEITKSKLSKTVAHAQAQYIKTLFTELCNQNFSEEEALQLTKASISH